MIRPSLLAGVLVGSIVIGGSTAVAWQAGVVWMCLGVVMVVMLWPRYAFWALVVTMPLDYHLPDQLAGIPLFDPLRYLVGAAIVMRQWKYHLPWNRLTRWTIGLSAGYCFAVLASLGWSFVNPSLGVPTLVWPEVAKLGGFVIFGLAAWLVVRDASTLWRVFVCLAIGLSVSNIYLIYQYAAQDWGPLWRLSYPHFTGLYWGGRPSGFVIAANESAGYTNLILPVLLSISLHSRRDRLGFMAATALAFVALLLTQSRGGWAAAAVELILIVGLWRSPAHNFAAVKYPILLVAGAVGAVFITVVPFTAQRLINVDYFDSSSRLGLWGAAFQLFLSSPIFGIGYATFKIRYPAVINLPYDFGSPLLDAHNLYLQLLSETGVVGAATYLAVVVCAVFAAFSAYAAVSKTRVRRDQRLAGMALGLAVAPIGVLIHGIVDYVALAAPQFAALFWMLALISPNLRMMALQAYGPARAVAGPQGKDAEVPPARILAITL